MRFVFSLVYEINDLNVFPRFRRRKVASALFDELEDVAAKTYRYIGLGVGLYRDYGPAQIMYATRGYVMDGNGIMYKNVPVVPAKRPSSMMSCFYI